MEAFGLLLSPSWALGAKRPRAPSAPAPFHPDQPGFDGDGAAACSGPRVLCSLWPTARAAQELQS